MRPHHRIGPLVAIVLAGAGCSTVPSQNDIKTFSAAVTDLSSYRISVVSGRRADQQRRDRVIQRLDRAGFTPAVGCVRGGEGCELVQRTNPPGQSVPTPQRITPALLQTSAPRGPDGKPFEVPGIPVVCRAAAGATVLETVTPEAVNAPSVEAEAPRPTEAAIFAALEDYAGALRAVADAADRKALDEANAKLVTAVTGLATTLGGLAGGAGAAAGPVAGAAAALALELRTALLERDRFVALQTSLRGSCIPVRTLGLAAGLILEGHRTARIALNSQVINRAGRLTMDLDAGPFATRADVPWTFTEAQQATNSTAGLAEHPWEAAKRLVAAHNALVAVVLEERGQGLEALVAVGRFARAVKSLRDAIAAAEVANR